MTEGLVASLKDQGREVLWLCMSALDYDPASCLLDIINAARRLHPNIGANTIQELRRLPGPVYGWSQLFDGLTDDLGKNLPADSALVFEGMHVFTAMHPFLIRRISRFLEKLPEDIKRFLISHQPLPQGLLSSWYGIGPDDSLRVDTQTCRDVLKEEDIWISDRCLQRVVKLTGGYRVSFSGILRACKLLGSEYVEGSVERASSQEMLLQDLATVWLSGAIPEELYATCLLLETGYYHSEMGDTIYGHSNPSLSPWLQPLKDNWQRLRSIWHSPLENILRIDKGVRVELLLLAADYLVKKNAPEIALSIYLRNGEFTRACEVLASQLDELLATGQWLNLKKWLNQIPENVMVDWPWLIYARGEMRAIEGDEKKAFVDFSNSTVQFSQQGDMQGLSHSLMGESTLAARRSDLSGAISRAKKSRSLVEQYGMKEKQVWADYQLGLLSANINQLSKAAGYLRAAVSTLEDSEAAGLVKQAQTHIQEHIELLDQQEHHRQELSRVDAGLQEGANKLESLWRSRVDDLPAFLEKYGWLHTPLMLKLPEPDGNIQELDGLATRPLFSRLLGKLGFHTDQKKVDDSHKPIKIKFAPPLNQFNRTPLPRNSGIIPTSLPQSGGLRKQKCSKSDVPKLTVYCLGPFRVNQDEKPVEEWLSSKGKAIFKYLVTHRDHPVAKEVLMDLFWPDSDPDSARNNLNVAIYNLRQSLRSTYPSYSHVIFQDESYLLNPELDIWLDYEAFLEQISLAKSLEQAGDQVAAINIYSNAEALYLGEFMEEDRYEDWPQEQRMYLQEQYIQLLDFLSKFHFDKGDYHACLTACRKMLAVDPCREEAHRLMMKCYILQGQPYLALRQYHQCVEVLKFDLQVTPSAETRELYERIRSAQDE